MFASISVFEHYRRTVLLLKSKSTALPMILFGAGSIFVLALVLWCGADNLFGRGVDPEGGFAGRVVDDLFRSFFIQKKVAKAHHDTNISYPLVSQRNSRNVVKGESTFLDIILSGEETNLQPAPRHTKNDYQMSSHFDLNELANAPTTSNTLTSKGCIPSWLCHRCLVLHRNAKELCQHVCPSCYSEILCAQIDGSKYLKDHIREKIEEEGSSSIPRIIHQVGDVEWLDPIQFPDLVRQQNSWRHVHNTSYRFYTEATGLEFIRQNYASLEQELRALTVSQQKSVLGLLALYHFGGVLADVNLLLEANLDFIWNMGLSFVASAKYPPAYSGCWLLYSGFVAARPRHPVLALAIALLLETSRWRNDNMSDVGIAMLWDSTYSQCSDHDEILEFGWCGEYQTRQGSIDEFILGKAFRETYSGASLIQEKGEFALFGTHSVSSSEERNLILLMSEGDTGATRLTDVSHNRLVASTNLVGESLAPILEKSSLRTTAQ